MELLSPRTGCSDRGKHQDGLENSNPCTLSQPLCTILNEQNPQSHIGSVYWVWSIFLISTLQETKKIWLAIRCEQVTAVLEKYSPEFRKKKIKHPKCPKRISHSVCSSSTSAQPPRFNYQFTVHTIYTGHRRPFVSEVRELPRGWQS